MRTLGGHACARRERRVLVRFREYARIAQGTSIRLLLQAVNLPLGFQQVKCDDGSPYGAI